MFLKNFAPARVVARQVYRAARALRGPQYLWRGVYSAFGDVPVAGRGYLSREWLESREASTRSLIAQLSADRSGSIPVGLRYGLLAAVVAGLPANDGSLRVVDYGGGFGIAYAYLRYLLPPDVITGLDHVVVETGDSCRIGASIFAGDPAIRFLPSVAAVSGSCDVVFVSGYSRYIEDYRAEVGALIRLSPRVVLFTLLPAGEIPTFASGQVNLRGSVLAHWFFRLSEIADLMANGGYRLQARWPAEESFDFRNFPERYRLDRMTHLLFARV